MFSIHSGHPDPAGRRCSRSNQTIETRRLLGYPLLTRGRPPHPTA